MTKKNYAWLGELVELLKGNYAVLLFPCNQFLGQEKSMPTPQRISEMSGDKLKDVDGSDHVFLMDKVEVNGPNAHPVFEYLRYNSDLYKESENRIGPIPWNFSKFLVDGGGGVFKFYSTSTDLKTIQPDLSTLLTTDNKLHKKARPSTIQVVDAINPLENHR